MIATHKMWLAVDGKHGVGRAAEVLGVYQEVDCDIIGVLGTRRRGQSDLLQAENVVYCNGKSGGSEKPTESGIGLAFRESISRAEVRSPEFNSDRLLKVTLRLGGRARAVAFVV